MPKFGRPRSEKKDNNASDNDESRRAEKNSEQHWTK
jgi:hypothetical protein